MENNLNFYQLLGVNKDASKDEIKKAFFQKVKSIGGPERNPEEYKKLREAHDTLFNPISRAEYDSMCIYGSEINTIIETINNEYKKENPSYDLIIRDLKKAVVLGPKIARLRSMLGEAFLGKEDYVNAFEQFNKACNYDSSNPFYWYLLGKTAEELKNIQQAEFAYKKSIELDPNSSDNNIALAHLYFNNDKKNAAYQILENAINADGVIDFADFSYFYHKVYFQLAESKLEEVKLTFKKINDIAKSVDDKKYAAWMFYKFAVDLVNIQVYGLARSLADQIVLLMPDDNDYVEFRHFVTQFIEAAKNYDLLKNDSGIHELVSEIVRVIIANYGGILKDDEFDNEFDEALEIISKYISVYPDGKEIRDSFKRIKYVYNPIFNINSKFFDSIINLPDNDYETFSGKCPHCSKYVTVSFGQNGSYTCPHCDRGIYYNGYGYSKGSSTSSNNGDCFVLTAIYQDELHPNVLFMRRYRDQVLSKSIIGRNFIRLYYIIGPIIANLIRDASNVKKACKFLIEKIIIKNVKKYFVE